MSDVFEMLFQSRRARNREGADSVVQLRRRSIEFLFAIGFSDHLSGTRIEHTRAPSRYIESCDSAILAP